MRPRMEDTQAGTDGTWQRTQRQQFSPADPNPIGTGISSAVTTGGLEEKRGTA